MLRHTRDLFDGDEPAAPRRHLSAVRQRSELAGFSERYADLADRRLADVLSAEDAAEEHSGLSPHERLTCHTHRRWAHQCISSPLHVIVVTGHRWCRQCERQASVAIDELTGSVSVTCDRCHQTPDNAATRQIIRTCTASLATAKDRDGALPAELSEIQEHAAA